MKSKVYFVPVEDADKIDDVNAKLSRLLAESRVLDFIGKDRRVAVKLHFGEAGTTGYVKDKKEKSGFINFAVRVNKECDCWTLDNERIAPDVGIFASSDPVAVDKASLDLVNASGGKEIFRAVHPEHNPLVQLEYAQQIGLGNLDYELIRI
jgi:uncharacterized Fe-S center protein